MSRPRLSTFSIVAWDPDGPAWGVAVASKFPAVGAVVPWAAAGSGAVATQSFANTSYGPRGLELMSGGISAEAALAQLLADDPDRTQRQIGLVDASGGAATFTGAGCLAWAGGRTGPGYAVQGNILAGPSVVDSIANEFEASRGALPERLVDALLAGDRAGGDRRGRQSAAIFVVRARAGYAGFNDRWIDYRVDDAEDPVPRLRELLEIHHLYFDQSPVDDRLPLEGETLERLRSIAARLGYAPSAPASGLDDVTRAALRNFLGNENFEDRVDLQAGTIDRPAFEYLMKRFE
ncbi:MAG TPA: DUF1028 domain-containing protein [Anaerolineales bacterium]|nr:DUF1028 domain-containing protein [Anaerolineales bacterium]